MYHVTSRGNERKPIYREGVDFNLFPDVLASPDWLAPDAILLLFCDERERACERFVAFVQAGVGINIWVHLKQQIYLGDDQFVSDQQQYIEKPVKGKALSS